MTQKHHLAIAFLLAAGAGFLILTGGNTYGAGKWGQSTFGVAYSFGNSL